MCACFAAATHVKGFACMQTCRQTPAGPLSVVKQGCEATQQIATSDGLCVTSTVHAAQTTCIAVDREQACLVLLITCL